MSIDRGHGIATSSVLADSYDLDGIIAKYEQFADTYLGHKAVEPTTDDDGDALIVGALYFNTVDNELRVYDGTDWQAVYAGALKVNNFTGDGTTVAFTMSTAPNNENSTQVYIDGVYQQKDTYTTVGAVLTFSEAPPTSAGIEVMIISSFEVSTADAQNVTYNQGGTGASSRTVENKLQEFVGRNDFGSDADFTTAGTSPTAKLSQIDFYSEGNSGVQLLAGPRGLSAKSTLTNNATALNAVPDGTPSGTNTNYAAVRAYAQDIIASPTGSRQSIELGMHFDTDSIIRGRRATRSEGSPSLQHADTYEQLNGTNWLYVAKQRNGDTGHVNVGFFPEGMTFKTGLVAWSASEVVSIGAERSLSTCDYLYLECTVGGTTGGTEPALSESTQLSDTFTDGTVTWSIETRLRSGSGGEVACAFWVDESGNVGYGKQDPRYSNDFGDTVGLRGGLVFNNGGVEGATLNNILSSTASLTFGSVSAQSANELTVSSITGAAVDDTVTISSPASESQSGITFSGYVSATDTVKVQAHNYSSGAISLSAATFRITVLKF